jgi:tetratricopeptide (TPR) repeat protein
MKKYNKPQGCLRSKNFTTEYTEITEKEEENKLKLCVLRVLRGYIFLILIFVLFGCASWGAVSAEEYFAIGMAYYDMGKYDEAEKWLSRAKAKDRTMVASEYNLGRIAFETGRYDDAIKYFESILKRDPNNVLALKAAAYTRIRNGDIEKAAALYDRVLALVPESADDGYNYALVLFAMKKYDEAETVLKNHEFALLDNNDVLLLYARAQKEQGKPEAIDTYDKWLVNNADAKVRYEYAQVLESHTLYARALEEYRAALAALSGNSVDPSKQDVRFEIASLLLVADPGSAEGITELKGAVDDGFSRKDKLQKLLENDRISAKNKEEIRAIISQVNLAAQAVAEKALVDELGLASGGGAN